MKRQFRNLTLEHKQRISDSMKGKKHSEETKQKISSAMREYWKTIPIKEE